MHDDSKLYQQYNGDYNAYLAAVKQQEQPNTVWQNNNEAVVPQDAEENIYSALGVNFSNTTQAEPAAVQVIETTAAQVKPEVTSTKDESDEWGVVDTFNNEVLSKTTSNKKETVTTQPESEEEEIQRQNVITGDRNTYAEELAKNRFMFGNKEAKHSAKDWAKLSDDERNQYILDAQNAVKKETAKRGNDKELNIEEEMLKLKALNRLGITEEIAQSYFKKENGRLDYLKYKDYIDESIYDHLFELNEDYLCELNEIAKAKDTNKIPQKKPLSKYEQNRFDQQNLAIDLAKFYGDETNPCYGDSITYLDNMSKSQNKPPQVLVYEYLKTKPQESLTSAELAKWEEVKELEDPAMREIVQKEFEKGISNEPPILNELFSEAELETYNRIDGEEAIKLVNTALTNKYGENTPEYFEAAEKMLDDAISKRNFRASAHLYKVLSQTEKGRDIITPKEDAINRARNAGNAWRFNSKQAKTIADVNKRIRQTGTPEEKEIAGKIAEIALRKESHINPATGEINNDSATVFIQAYNVENGFGQEHEYKAVDLNTNLTDKNLQKSNVDFFMKHGTEDTNVRVIDTAGQLHKDNQVYAIEQRTSTGNEKYINAAVDAIKTLHKDNQTAATQATLKAAVETGNQKAVESIVSQINTQKIDANVAKDPVIAAQIAKVEQKYILELAKKVSDFNSEVDKVSGNNSKTREEYIKEFTKASPQEQYRMLAKLPDSLKKEAFAMMAKYNPSMLKNFVLYGNGAQILHIPGLPADVVNMVVNIMLNDNNLKNQQIAAEFIKKSPSRFRESTYERAVTILDSNKTDSNTVNDSNTANVNKAEFVKHSAPKEFAQNSLLKKSRFNGIFV